ncbi:hypothetical protein JNK13_05155 [bacterium]|nr:hypothetical protein [bacterium]
MRKLLLFICIFAASPVLSQDIVFITQVPFYQGFGAGFGTFGNHKGGVYEAPRGGDLWIRYADGTYKNLTQTAGYGNSGFQGANSIAVRDPAVHWSGTKVIFSMVIGAPTHQYQVQDFYFQIYEVTGLGKNETPVITKVPNQPVDFNNVMPTYGTDDKILFMSDRPRNGARHLYPQRDEYESSDIVSGLWSLNPTTGELKILDHAPSGAFNPLVDSFGRVIYSRWDHLQQDQQADAGGYGAFNYADESESASRINSIQEFFPEPRSVVRQTDPTLNLHTFNFFFPWQINEDGTEHETLNHVGRHELAGYFDRSFNDDPNLDEFYDSSTRFNQNPMDIFLHLSEDPLNPGTFLGTRCQEFGTHASGQIASINGAPTVPAHQMSVTYLTHPDTAFATDNPSSNHSGLYRDPIRLSNGNYLAAHTTETRQDENAGSGNSPNSRYQYRIRYLAKPGAYYTSATALTSGISKTVDWWSPDVHLNYSGQLWELQPIELRSRTRPGMRQAALPAIEQTVIERDYGSVETLRTLLRENNLALIVSRDVLTRDSADKQQPFNLKIPGTDHQKLGAGGKIYDVEYMQIFQGDQVRGYGGVDSPQAGRRIIAKPLHDPAAQNVPHDGPVGSVKLGVDGSMAALVPAQRALTWHLTDDAGKGVVRERVWLTFQPGEIRVCASCHGVNNLDQTGSAAPINEPMALSELVQYIKNNFTPVPPPQESTWTMKIIGRDQRNKNRNNNIYSKKGFSVSLVSAPAKASEQVNIRLSIADKICGNSKQVQSFPNGTIKLSGKAAKINRKSIKLKYEAYVNHKLAASKNAEYRNSRSSRKGKLSGKEFRSLCKSLIASLK